MKINNVSFPHPVLGIGDDVAGHYSVECKVGLDKEKITLIIIQNLNNFTLSKLIEEGKAVFGIEINCPQTFYRKSFLSKNHNETIEIPSDELRNKTLVSFYISATEKISNYQISGSNFDYQGYTFEVDKGDILAFGGSTNFPAEKDWQALMAVTSFMEISSYDKPSGNILFELTQTKVFVRMNSKDFDRYGSIKGVKNLYPIFHASIVFPALLYALHNMRETDDYEGSDWYQTLDYRIKNEEQFRGLDRQKYDDIPEIAQILLKNPVSRSLSSIEQLQKEMRVEE